MTEGVLARPLGQAGRFIWGCFWGSLARQRQVGFSSEAYGCLGRPRIVSARMARRRLSG